MTDVPPGRPNPSDDAMSTVPGDRAQPGNVPIDEEAVSEPAAGPDGDQRVAQTNVGRENMEGTGEWPDPDEPPTGAAPGTDPARQRAIEAQRAGATTTAEDVLAEDPVAGGSGSIGGDAAEK